MVGDLCFFLHPSSLADTGAEAEIPKAAVVCASVMAGGALGAPVGPPKEKGYLDLSPVTGAPVTKWNGLFDGGSMLFVAAESEPTKEKLGAMDTSSFSVSAGFGNSSFFVADLPVSGFTPK